MNQKPNSTGANNAYNLWRVKRQIQGFKLLTNFVSGGKGSASKTAIGYMRDRWIKRILCTWVLSVALLNDANCILIKPGENTQAARLIQFTNARKIVEMEPILKTKIYEAIEAE